ncbi:DUF4255 domain-containing protein [Roseateles sp. So40a]|uniref:DUF4255 domain-containing protein n=1 Tax=Roseateles sp. So40a TaxID=3400226 RepID=UPI003A8A20D7
MIDAALQQVAQQLNQHLRHRLGADEDLVALTNLLEQNGGPVPLAQNKLVMFLAGIERDMVAHRAAAPGGLPSRLQTPDPVYLNLLVMCAANFSGTNYTEALKCLSAAIAFFQSRPVMDHQNCPGMDSALERLTLNIENLSSAEMHSLWSIHSGRYLPSVLYRIRLVSVDSQWARGRDILIGQTDRDLRGNLS